MNTFLICMLAVGIIVAVAVSAVLTKCGKNARLFNTVAFCVVLCYAVLLAFFVVGEGEGAFGGAIMYICSALLVALIVALTLFLGKREQFDTFSVCFGALCVALSFVLSFVKYHAPFFAGSVTLASTFPLMLYSYVFGVRKGVICAVVYGFLQFVQGPFVLHYVQVLLDYPVAFMALGLAGLLRERNILSHKPALQYVFGGLFATFLRYVSHVLSGYFFWRESAVTNVDALIFSAVTNSFVFVDFAIVAVVACVCFNSKTFCTLIKKYN